MDSCIRNLHSVTEVIGNAVINQSPGSHSIDESANRRGSITSSSDFHRRKLSKFILYGPPHTGQTVPDFTI
jgi:hypothetical protein